MLKYKNKGKSLMIILYETKNLMRACDTHKFVNIIREHHLNINLKWIPDPHQETWYLVVDEEKGYTSEDLTYLYLVT